MSNEKPEGRFVLLYGDSITRDTPYIRIKPPDKFTRQCVGGRRLTPETAFDIIQLVNSCREGRDVMIVLQLGSNNLGNRNPRFTQTVDEYITLLKQTIRELITLTPVTIIVCTLLPRPDINDKIREANRKIQKFCASITSAKARILVCNAHVPFLNPAPCRETVTVNRELYKPDGIHLKPLGQRLLSQRLSDAMNFEYRSR